MKSAKAQPKVRRQTSFAAEDESVLRWWDAQRDIALSLHDIITETIERNGYGDYHFREVEQRPRVGRPPKRLDLDDADDDDSSLDRIESAKVVSSGGAGEAAVLTPVTHKPEAAVTMSNDPAAMDSLIDSL